MSGAFQPSVMAHIFPRYSFTFSCTQPGQILSGGRMEAKIISALMYDLIPRWQRLPAYSLIWLLPLAKGDALRFKTFTNCLQIWNDFNSADWIFLTYEFVASFLKDKYLQIRSAYQTINANVRTQNSGDKWILKFRASKNIPKQCNMEKPAWVGFSNWKTPKPKKLQILRRQIAV